MSCNTENKWILHCTCLWFCKTAFIYSSSSNQGRERVVPHTLGWGSTGRCCTKPEMLLHISQYTPKNYLAQNATSAKMKSPSPTSDLPPDPWGHWSSSFLSGYIESTQAWEVLLPPPHFCQAAPPPALFPWWMYNFSLCRSSGCHSICLFLPPSELSSSPYLGSDFKRRRRRLIIKNVLLL